MKWPLRLTLIRHDISVYNEMKKRKEADPEHQRFKELYEKGALTEAETAEMLVVADYLRTRYGLRRGDWDTPLAKPHSPLGKEVGTALAEASSELPDIVYVSPYERTLRTLDGLRQGWPALREVKTVEDDRLREQEHGLALLFNDWRVFQSLHPEQRALREVEGRYWYRYPQGENVPDVRERMRSWQNTLVREHAGQRVLAVTHHLCLLALRANLERWSAAEFERVDEEDKPINCGVTIYRGDPHQGRDGRLILEQYNKKLYE